MRHLRSALRSLRRRPAFSLATAGSIAVGVAIAVAVLHVVRLEPGLPPQLSPTLEIEGVRSTAWSQDVSWRMLPASEIQDRGLGRLLIALATMAALALAIAGLNAAVLLLNRAVSRRREFALRSALGATPGRLAALPLAEGAILGLVGTAVGLLLGLAGGWALRATWPHPGAGVASSELYPLTLVFGLGAALCAPLGSAVATRIATAAGTISGLLAAGARSSGDTADAWLRNGLAVVQLAVAAVLLSGAAILVESERPAGNAALRYDPTDTLHVRMELVEGTPEARARLLRDLYLDARDAPDVRAAALATPGAWFARGDVGFVRAECGMCYRGGVYVPVSVIPARHHAIGPGFFAALNLEVVEGREFNLGDGPDRSRVALVNRAFAMAHFQDGEPIGRSVQVGGLDGPEFEVIGVVDEVASPPPDVPEAIYLPLLQAPTGAVDLLAPGDGDTDALADAIAPLVASAGIRSASYTPLPVSFHEQRAPLRWLAVAFTAVGFFALALALYGLASVILQIVDSRRKEIGVRRALGATPGAVVRLIVGYAIKLSLAGGTLGLWGALILTAWLGKVDPELRMFDPVRYGIVMGLVLAAAVAGGVLSARSAVRIAPTEALAAE